MNNNLNDLSGLKRYGLSERFEQQAALHSGLYIARITEQHRDLYNAVSQGGELSATVAGRLAHTAESPLDYPAVGDWVMLDRPDGAAGNAVIRCVLPRKSLLMRQAAGTAGQAQAIAANIDTIFICMSLNADFNLRRTERYLAMAWESGAAPVIVLTKADLCRDLPDKLRELAAVSMGVTVAACSVHDGGGDYKAILPYTAPGQTVAFIGSSGVGKSTLINALLGRETIATGAIREDDAKGRHTTTHRQMLCLPNGGIVIDTPGMRELHLGAANLSKAFEDIEDIALGCRFSDCAHGTEPGCAVRKAMDDGTLDAKRFESYQKLQRETSYDGLNARQLENEKINRMFGGKKEMKNLISQVKKGR